MTDTKIKLKKRGLSPLDFPPPLLMCPHLANAHARTVNRVAFKCCQYL